MKTLYSFFDPKNPEHLHEFQTLRETGSWSVEFFQQIKDLDFGPNWHFALLEKIVDQYIKDNLTK